MLLLKPFVYCMIRCLNLQTDQIQCSNKWQTCKHIFYKIYLPFHRHNHETVYLLCNRLWNEALTCHWYRIAHPSLRRATSHTPPNQKPLTKSQVVCVHITHVRNTPSSVTTLLWPSVGTINDRHWKFSRDVTCLVLCSQSVTESMIATATVLSAEMRCFCFSGSRYSRYGFNTAIWKNLIKWWYNEFNNW